MSERQKFSETFLKGIPQTYLTQLIGAVLGVILLKITATSFTSQDFGAWMVARRLIALIAPIVSLNLGISLGRFPSQNKSLAKSYFTSTTIIMIIILIVVWSFGFMFNKQWILLLWKSDYYGKLWPPVLFLIAATSFQLISVGFWRGTQNYNKMNRGILFFKAIPLAIIGILVLLKQPSIKIVIFSIWGSAVLLFIYHISDHLINRSFKLKITKKSLNPFVKYGTKRLPSGIFYMAFFAIPVFYATALFNLEIAGYIGILISVINLVSLFASPANLILLPKFSLIGATESKESTLSKVLIFTEFLWQVPILLGPVLFLFSPEIIHYWFGEKFYHVVAALTCISPGISGLMIFIFLRGVLDGLEEKPHVNAITFISLIILILSMIVLKGYTSPIMSISIALTAGFISLGVTIMVFLNIALGKIIKFGTVASSLIILILYYVLFYFLNDMFLKTGLMSLIVKTAVLCLMMVLHYFYINKKNPPWVQLIIKGFSR